MKKTDSQVKKEPEQIDKNRVYWLLWRVKRRNYTI